MALCAVCSYLQTVPSEFVEDARNIKEEGGGFKTHGTPTGAVFYIVRHHSVLRDGHVTNAWIDKFESAREGRISNYPRYKSVKRICTGLCRVVNEGDKGTCTCRWWYEKFICPHIIFAMDLTGEKSIESLSMKLGKVRRSKGRKNKTTGARERQPESPEPPPASSKT